MYKRILLASDGTPESLTALREGALLARACRAQVHLLIVSTGAVFHPDTVTSPIWMNELEDLLAKGLGRLKALGLAASGEVAIVEPIQAIAQSASRFRADLVVVGHRRRNMLERWWSGPSGAYIIDRVNCSVMVARNVVTDEEMQACLSRDAAPVPAGAA